MAVLGMNEPRKHYKENWVVERLATFHTLFYVQNYLYIIIKCNFYINIYIKYIFICNYVMIPAEQQNEPSMPPERRCPDRISQLINSEHAHHYSGLIKFPTERI